MTSKQPCKTKDCIVCGKASSSYKCPRCFAFYCCKDCCTSHKQVCTITSTAVHNTSSLVRPSTNVTAPQEKIEKNENVANDIFPERNDLSLSLDQPMRPPPQQESQPQSIDLTLSTMPTDERVKILKASLELKDKDMTINDPEFLFNLKQDIFLLSDEDKRRLREDPQLKTLLKSKRLQKDLEVVDMAADRKVALRTLREKNKEFDQVACLMYDIVKRSETS